MLAESVQGEDNASPGLGGAEDEPRAEAPAETDTQGEETDSYDEIIVTGRLEVEAAKQEVIQDLQSEGYTELKRKKNYLLLRHPSNWKGEIRLYDDGWVLMKRQPIRFVAPAVPWAKENSPLAVVSCLLYPTACIRVGGQMVSRAKLGAQKARTLEVAGEDMRAWGERVADMNTSNTIDELPDRLFALWDLGESLEESPTQRLVSFGERRRALFQFWEERTDTLWGNRVRAAVEIFIREEIQSSDHPFFVEELAAMNARRRCRQALDLSRPWSEVELDLKGRDPQPQTPGESRDWGLPSGLSPSTD